MTDQTSTDNPAEPGSASTENPFQGGLVELLTDERPKLNPRDFRFRIIYLAWLLGWVLLALEHFPKRVALLNGERLLNALGYAFVFAPVIALGGVILAAPITVLAVWVYCAISNALGYRKDPDRTSEYKRPIVTFPRWLMLASAVFLIFILATLEMHGYRLEFGDRVEYFLSVLYFIAFVIGLVYLCFCVGPDRSAEQKADTPGSEDS